MLHSNITPFTCRIVNREHFCIYMYSATHVYSSEIKLPLATVVS